MTSRSARCWRHSRPTDKNKFCRRGPLWRKNAYTAAVICRKKPTKVKVCTRSFEVCCADCAAKTEQYIKLDKRFKTALYLLVFLGGIGFVNSAFFGGDSPLRMIGAYAGQLVAGLAFIAFSYPVTSFESFHAMSIRGVTRLTRIIGLVLSVSAVVLIVLTLR